MALDLHVLVGRTIRIKQSDLSEMWKETGSYPRPGMMAKVVGFDELGDEISLGVDYSPYETHNLPLEEATIEQADGRLLTHRQAGEYRASSIIFFNGDRILDECEIVDDNPHLAEIMDAFSREAASGLSYQEFLENQLIRAMQDGYDIETGSTHVRTL